jgi:hypothetical protein
MQIAREIIIGLLKIILRVSPSCAVVLILQPWLAAQVPANSQQTDDSQKIRKVVGKYSDMPPEAQWSERGAASAYALRVEENHTQFHLLSSPLSEGQRIVRIYDYRSPEALPVKTSSAVVVGMVSSAQATIAPQGNAVYSQYVVVPTRIIKQNYQSPILTGSEITAFRDGGVVRFPSGKVSYVLVKGKGFPKIGAEYIWFLRQDADTGPSEYEVRTAYQVTSAGVVSLDDEPPYRDLNGLSAADVINKIGAAVTRGGSQ